MLYLPKMPKIIKKLFPAALYRISGEEKKIYLTFDDGPTPEITSWVFTQLKQYNANATFFWLGKNMAKHPEYIERALQEGHTIGNHTFHHPSGWKTRIEAYLEDIEKCDEYYSSKFFRPPYGEITIGQYKVIKKLKKIVMWDVVSYDFDIRTDPEKCLKNVMTHVAPGSIVVFHDSLKAWRNLKWTLPRVLHSLSNEGCTFAALGERHIGFS